MKIVLATSNRGKVKELKEYLNEFEIITYDELVDAFEIIEDGKTFKDNALIKAKAVYEKLKCDDCIVLADDSGISVPILDNRPGVYSARYAGVNATSKDNLLKLINEIKAKKVKKTKAYYTASIAIVSKKGEFTVHGWMYGSVIDEKRGDNGFGYDPMFIPEGFDLTLGELGSDIKKSLSHRAKAIELIKYLLD